MGDGRCMLARCSLLGGTWEETRRAGDDALGHFRGRKEGGDRVHRPIGNGGIRAALRVNALQTFIVYIRTWLHGRYPNRSSPCKLPPSWHVHVKSRSLA